jgi:Tfp pilus assembly protein PilF
MEYSSHEKAIEWFKTGLKVCTNDQERSELWGYIGDVYHELGNDNKAFKAYDKALRYDADNALVLNNYAYFLAINGGSLEKALAMSKLAVVLEKSANSYSLDTYAWILHLMGRDQEAKKYMSQALSLSGQQDPTYLAHYADILWALGEKFMAEVYWKKALEMGYDSEELAEHIATLKQQSSTK